MIALKAKYVRETEALQNAVKALGANVEIFTMRTYYPAGDEQVLVNQVTVSYTHLTLPTRAIV